LVERYGAIRRVFNRGAKQGFKWLTYDPSKKC
jgi:hypothetical protein